MKYKINQNVLIQEDSNEYVLLNMDNGMFYGLDETGTVIVKLLKKNNSYQSIVNKLHDRYGISKERIINDLNIFIKEMLKFGIVKND